MEESFELVKKFQEDFEKPMTHKRGEEPLEIRQLRGKLFFEEYGEYMEAIDCRATMAQLCLDYLKKLSPHKSLSDGNNVNLVEQADSLGDMQVILNGSVLTARLERCFPEIVKAICYNNLSKWHTDEHHAMETVDKNKVPSPQIVFHKGRCLLYNKDGKLTKPWNHTKVLLEPIIDSAECSTPGCSNPAVCDGSCAAHCNCPA